jgi:phytol kinase
MTDLGMVLMWSGVLAASFASALALRALGLATTYVRDLLHIGAGVWVLGWPMWERVSAPIAVVAVVAAVVASVPLLAGRLSIVARFRASVASGDERFAGLIAYACSYLVLTTVGLLGEPFPAAAGLLALSLGDGIGGAVGRRFGRHRFRTPFAKEKTFEGSVMVAIAASIGAAIAAALFGITVSPSVLVVLGAIAAAAEGMAPRSSDNVLVPAAVWVAATLLT